jgi:hypothetical protein
LGTGYLSLLAMLCAGQSSVLQSGPWYKVAVETRGVYKITYDQFRKMSFDPTSDPRKIKIYGYGGGMLPQRNSDARPAGLEENSIFVSGEDDGVFDKDDYILFFAEGPYNVRYDIKRKIFSYQSNLYSEKNFYFITVSPDNGKRVATSENLQGTFPLVQHFDDYVYHEADEYNDLQSGREWFGERYDLVTSYAYRFDVSGVRENSSIKIVSDVMAQSFNGSSFKLLFNKTQFGEQVVPTISNTQYSIKGRHKRDTLTIDANTVSAPGSTTQEIQYQYVKASSGKSVGFLDFLLVNFSRHLALYGDQTIFTTSSSLDNAISQYAIGGVNENCSIWDITNTSEIKSQSFNLESETATFSTTSDVLREFVVFNTSVPSPELIGYVLNQNLRGSSPVNLIVVSNPAFEGEAHRLASHRQAHSGWSTLVVTPEEIYNEFSSGRQDVSAIRDFVKHMYDKNPGVLKALLIVGKGSYDYKDRMPNNTNFVPTYESRNSLAPLETYSSDDYFAFLENHEGHWGEGPIENHTLEIGVGRLPVKTIEEAKNVVDKIIGYDSNKKNYGSWRKDVVFVADDGSTSDGFTSTHQNQANTMAESIEDVHGSFDTKKIFLGTYSKTVKPNGEVIPEVNRDISSWFDRGSIVINYTGHGSEKLLADERVFTVDDINALENESYPFMVTATCEFGRQDDPAIVSSAELTVIHPKGGTIGLVTTARPVNSPTNFLLNQEFYSSLFEREQGKYIPLGEVFKRTKNSSMSGVSNRNFSLLGDPSLTLALPTNSISIGNIKTSTGSDTLKALSLVTVSGEVQDETATRIASFNGILEATLFDKEVESVTIGKNDPPYKFKERNSTLYRGKASVKEGEFEFQFIVPKNIAYNIGEGKLSLYAFDLERERDAGGASSAFKIGGSEKNPPDDDTPPTINAWVGDTTFINGGVANPNTSLVVKLQDASGINISNYGIGNSLVAILDNNDEQVFTLSDYFQTETDDYTTGWVNYPLKDLVPGRHTITVKAWDTYNNPAEASVDFIVTDGQVLIIESLGNSPNPFENETMIFFTHNRSGDDLEALLHIYSLTGQEIKAYNLSIPASPYYVELLEINGFEDFGKKLPGGVYLARLAVRSLTNGSKSERVTKLIVVN